MGEPTIKQFFQFEGKALADVVALDQLIFSQPYPLEKMKKRVADKTAVLILIAYNGENPVAFKIGFNQEGIFHSWIGGVLPEFRGRGLAKELIKIQHQWARQQGFSRIRTHTDHRFNSMLILNIKQGFEIIAIESRQQGPSKIILEKSL